MNTDNLFQRQNFFFYDTKVVMRFQLKINTPMYRNVYANDLELGSSQLNNLGYFGAANILR